MVENFFLHRIQKENNEFSKGIEVHDTLDSAVRAFWGRMKLGFNNPSYPNMTFVSCKITDGSGNTVAPYDMTWKKAQEEGNTFFMHHIMLDGETYSKNIDVFDDYDAACCSFAATMEYGYGNPAHPHVTFVSCEITDINGMTLDPFNETWNAPEAEPEA